MSNASDRDPRSATAAPVGSVDTALRHTARLLATDPTLAAEQATEVLRVAPNQPLALAYLGAARRALGDSAGAIEALRRAVALQPSFVDAWRTLDGFYGFAATFNSHEGVATCPYPNLPWRNAPCSDLNGRSTGSGITPKLNLTYKITSNKMIYATYSKGFRPGGVNRNGGGKLPPYKPDYLINWEFGWKTQWDQNRFRWNGALFYDKWKDFQFAFLGPNALTIIANAGAADVKGIESDVAWRATRSLTLTSGIAYLDAKLTQEYCADPTGAQCYPGTSYEQYAPNGQQLPVTPKFKGNVTARYTFMLGSLHANVQGSAVYVGSRWADLRMVARNDLGREPAYTLADLSFGIDKGSWHAGLYVNNVFDKRAVLDRFAQCDVATCGSVAIYNVPNQPRTIGVKFGQRF